MLTRNTEKGRSEANREILNKTIQKYKGEQLKKIRVITGRDRKTGMWIKHGHTRKRIETLKMKVV